MDPRSITRQRLQSRWIVLEDKGLSLALHYALAPNIVMTRAWLDELIAPVGDQVHATHGHQVLNITPHHAPDKGDAVIDGGRVTEIGSHEELLKAGGRYSRLFELQAAGYR